ncbi:MAG: GatB/YqeY domain-containing protein [Candidatus Sungbacteria bacterium]|nr:GatB/YqeY domain-containing protein [Candidatus Sungbacteria bacterium]
MYQEDMLEKIQNDIKDAMRAHDELKLSVLRMLSAAIHNREIEKKSRGGEAVLTDDEIIAVIRSEVKKRRDAVEGFTKGGRMNMAEKEQMESKILESYMPQESADEEIEKIVKEVIASMSEDIIKPFDQAQGKNFGKIMGAVMKKIGGLASGDKVKAVVEKFLVK